jgi:penicillin amidase
MDAAWFDDVRNAERETKSDIVGRALAGAWEEAAGRWGNDPARWSYAALHTLTLDHPFGSAPLVGRWFPRGPFPVPGSASTVAAFGARWRRGLMDVTSGPSMRMITDLAALDRTVAILPGGQSGHPWDPLYDDQIPDYLAGRVRPFPWTPAAIEAAAVSHLRLSAAPETGADG